MALKNEQILKTGTTRNIKYYAKTSLNREIKYIINRKLTEFDVSKAFDRFEIYANNLHYFYDNIETDWAVESFPMKMTGSKVCMEIRENSTTELVKVFKRFQSPQSLSFNQTEIIVELARIGEEVLMSRSQAKRILFGLEKFKRIVLNFHGVTLIGQGFVDEIFRIFQNASPTIKIEYINANNDVEFMIKRSL